MIDVIVNSNEITDLVSRLYGVAADDAPRIIALAARDLTTAHLTGIANKRHHSPYRNFYQDAADAAEAKFDNASASVEIPHTGLALRYYGGTVRPSGRISLITGKPIERLAIPIKGSGAEGKTPGDFKGVFFIKGRYSGKSFLAGKKPNGMIGLIFALVPKTRHTADKSILPTTEEYNDVAVNALTQLLEELDR